MCPPMQSNLSTDQNNSAFQSLASLYLNSEEKDESAEWLNAIIDEIWPYAANIAQVTVLEYIQPALEANVPPQLPVPRFTKIDIGKDSISVENISVFDKRYGKDSVAAVIEADVVYDGNPQVQMALGDFTFGVNHARLQGRVEILLMPLIPRVPLIGAFQIAFVNPPNVEYTLTGMATLGNHPWLQGLITSVANDVLAQMVVLPNRIAIPLTSDVSFFDFSAHPVGILRIAARSGSGFPSTDEHWLKQMLGISALPDVYLCLQHGATKFRTDHVSSSANPIWTHQIFDFVVASESPAQELKIAAYDSDVGQDDFLGRATILISELLKENGKEIGLLGSPDNATPTVKISAKWLHLSADTDDIQNAIVAQHSDINRPKDCSYFLLTVDIDEARNLPSNRRPFVKVTVGSQVYQTNPAYDLKNLYSVENPNFEKSFSILLKGTVNGSTRIEYNVLDGLSGELIGCAYSSVSEAIADSPQGRIYDFALMDAHRSNATLKVKVKIWAIQDDPPLWNVLEDRTNPE